jgi:hypothetical protein
VGHIALDLLWLTISGDSTAEGEEPEPFGLVDEVPAVSGSFKYIMNVQLTLILFLGISWLYDQV